MKMWKKVLLTAIPAALMLSFTSLAGEWHLDMNGWWYETEDGSYYKDGWQWVDGNNDGSAECYYFNSKGYAITNVPRADGYEINENGAWTVNGVVQKKEVAIRTNNDSRALAVYEEAQKKNSSLDSMDVDADYKISMNADGTSMDMGMNLNLKLRGARTGNLEFTAEGSMDMLGSDMPLNMFYTNGYYYADMMGMKIKQAMPMEEALKEASSNIDVMEVDTSFINNLRMREEGNKTILTFDNNAAALNRYLEELMGGTSFSDLGMDMSYVINASNGEAVIDENGYYTSQKMYMDMDIVVTDKDSKESETIKYVMDISMKVNNPGQEVSFTIPSTEGYVDIDNETE